MVNIDALLLAEALPQEWVCLTEVKSWPHEKPAKNSAYAQFSRVGENEGTRGSI